MATKILIHKGKVTRKIPAVTREVMDTDPESKTFGSFVTEEVTPEKELTHELPEGAAFGGFIVRKPYELTDPATIKMLKKKGFEEVGENTKAVKEARAEEREFQDLVDENTERAHALEQGTNPLAEEEPETKKRGGK